MNSSVSASGKAASAPASLVEAPGIVAFDLDGTVLDTIKRTISPRVQAAFVAAHEAGSLLTVVSGRPVHMLGRTLLSSPWLDWRITVNGASVSRASDGQVISHRPLTHEQTMDVLASIADLRPAWNAFLPDETFFENRSFSYLAGNSTPDENVDYSDDPSQIKRVLSDVTFIDSIPREFMGRDEGADKLGCSFRDNESCDAAERLLTARGDLEVARMSSYELELTARGVTKGTAIGILCEELGLAEKDAVAFGDSGNDLSMAGRAGTFVAVANGSDEARAAADEVCPSITDDGVAQWLEARLG